MQLFKKEGEQMKLEFPKELYKRHEETLAGKLLKAFQNSATTFEIDLV